VEPYFSSMSTMMLNHSSMIQGAANIRIRTTDVN
jgi:hypothetical protein